MGPGIFEALASNHIDSCPVFVGPTTLLAEGSCLWAKVTGRKVNHSAADIHTERATFRMGGQKEIATDWFLGGLAGFGSSWSQAGNSASANGQTAEGAVALKRAPGPRLALLMAHLPGEGPRSGQGSTVTCCRLEFPSVAPPR